MPLPPRFRVKSCMGCIPLQRGCIILGFSGMVFSMLEIGKHIQMLVDFELSVKQCRRKEVSALTTETGSHEEEGFSLVPDGETKEENNNPFLTANDDDLQKDQCPPDSLVRLVRFILGFASFTYAIYFMMTIMMVYGVTKKRAKMMTPWMVWVVAQLFFDIISLLGLGHGATPFTMWAFTDVLVNFYFILIVNSYYLELKESEERRLGVTVVAVTQTANEMMVVIPTGPKDDPPPPYPGLSACNPAYNFGGPGGYPGYPMQTQTVTLSPPQYQQSTNFTPVNQASSPVPIPGSPAYSSMSTPNYQDSSGEAAPLVEKPPLPNN